MSMHFNLIMKCCVEKRGLRIVVRKGGEKRGSRVESCGFFQGIRCVVTEFGGM
jgi:hypothetical protein